MSGLENIYRNVVYHPKVVTIPVQTGLDGDVTNAVNTTPNQPPRPEVWPSNSLSQLICRTKHQDGKLLPN